MAEQHEKALVPQIRFTGFTDPWEQRKLGEVAHFINGRAYSQNELLSSGKYPVLRVGNFYTNDSWYYSNLELEDKNYAYEGDLLYTWSATFGPHIWHGNKVIYHYHIWKVQLEAAFEKLFAFQLLERDKERILSDKNGSTMVHITKIGIENTSVLMPCSVIEQRQIGAFFDRLDSLITLHQRKYDKLCVLKKSMLDKMFPKGGSLYPEIRFAGFTNHWEQRKLGELFEESDERASDREILSVSVANGIYPASESDRETNPGASLANYKVVHSGDVVYNSMRMWQGAVDASRYDGIVSPAYVVAKPNSEVYARFFARLLRQPMLLKQYQQVSQGNSKDTQVLKFDDFASIEISMPASENEQRRIGAFFDRLDSLITLHQRKLELLRNIKKSMLDKMFV
ncbi:restriction endonuclease subunit S [Bifidobacterium adolescentis]|jgi:type I restriction enzyme S subunit|uniref:restriction endonuclease subunit S n=2 Tax=Bifidobacterium adolescentis TaxID=1680 RepID=UPI000A9D6253|nr:restriction endonuclease subunit S [Bifidobacterium adolescentis]